MNKKIIAGIVAGILAVGVAGGLFFFRNQFDSSDSSDDNVVYVAPAVNYSNQGVNLSGSNKFAGVVESEKTVKVNKDSERTVKDILVESGQEVSKGDILFTYDTTETADKIAQAQLELERIQNEKSSMNSNIAELQKQLNNASGDNKTNLTLQVQEAQLDLKKKEYEEKQKQAEIEKLQKTMNSASVVSEIDGIIKSVNKDDTSSDDAFITILSTGAYRVKGQLNEQNIGSLVEGEAVIVHSRVDGSQTWKGSIDKIDTENATSGNVNSYGSSSDSLTSSSTYPFYITLESSDGLMLGQHVYIELDLGQYDTSMDGFWLNSAFIADLDTDPYVWAENDKEQLEKRSVTIGEINEETGMVEIKDGLTGDDYITWPETGLEEGMTCVISSDGDFLGQSNPDVTSDSSEASEASGSAENSSSVGEITPESTAVSESASTESESEVQ